MTRANFNIARTTTAELRQLLRRRTRGRRQSPDDQSGHPLRAGEDGRARSSTDFQLKNNWAPRIGATYDLTGDGKTKLFGNFGMLLRAHSERPRGARAVGRRRHQPRRLLRRQPDAADSRTARRSARRAGDQPLPDSPASAPTRSIRTRSCRTCASSCSASSARSCRTRRSASATSTGAFRACSRTWRTARWWRTTLGGDVAAVRQRRLHPDQPDQRDADQPGAARDRAAVRGVQVRRSGPQVRRGRVHPEPPHGEQLVADGVVPLVAAARQLRGVLPRRQRPVGSGHLVALRLPDQRSDLHVDRRPQLGYPATSASWATPNGILPLDRPHQVKLFGNYAVPVRTEPRRRPEHRRRASR